MPRYTSPHTLKFGNGAMSRHIKKMVQGQRVQQQNTPQGEAGRATSSEELKRRIRARRKKDVTPADSG
jgi:hypothetical protein